MGSSPVGAIDSEEFPVPVPNVLTLIDYQYSFQHDLMTPNLKPKGEQ